METFAKPSTLKFLNVEESSVTVRERLKKGSMQIRAGKSSKAKAMLKVEKKRAGGLVRISAGLPFKVLVPLGAQLDMPVQEVAEIAGITVRTYHRRKEQGGALTVSESDATLRIARIVEEANRVFGDAKRATNWLRTTQVQLGVAPIELLASDAGTQAVQDELTRIHWGDYA